MRPTPMLALALASCVSQGAHDAVVAERDLLAAQVDELEERVEELESDNARLTEEIAQVSGAESKRQERLAEAYEVLDVTEGQDLAATIRTTLGEIECDLWLEVAPMTVTNFVQLSEGTREWTDPTTGETRTDPLYDGTVFHRTIEGFMVQGGDPTGTGRGGPGYRFEDEVSPDVVFDEPGLLAMANAGPGTNGSQFFITDSEPRYLDGRHTIFGKCDLDVVREILAQPKKPEPRGKPWRPVEPVTIEHIDITRG